MPDYYNNWNTTPNPAVSNWDTGIVGAGSTDIVLVVFLGFLAAIAAISVLAYINKNFFERIFKSFSIIGVSFNYALIGTLTAACIGVIYWIIEFVVSLHGDGYITLKQVAYLILGYIGLSVLGYITEKVIEKYKDRYSEMNGHKERTPLTDAD